MSGDPSEIRTRDTLIKRKRLRVCSLSLPSLFFRA
nr:MAG TPA: hypothetical protein [Inoviridae sp.]